MKQYMEPWFGLILMGAGGKETRHTVVVTLQVTSSAAYRSGDRNLTKMLRNSVHGPHRPRREIGPVLCEYFCPKLKLVLGLLTSKRGR